MLPRESSWNLGSGNGEALPVDPEHHAVIGHELLRP